MELATRIQILNEAVCVSLRTNAHGKNMNLSLFLPVGQIGFLSLGKVIDLEGKLNPKPALLYLKIDYVTSCPWLNIYIASLHGKMENKKRLGLAILTDTNLQYKLNPWIETLKVL